MKAGERVVYNIGMPISKSVPFGEVGTVIEISGDECTVQWDNGEVTTEFQRSCWALHGKQGRIAHGKQGRIAKLLAGLVKDGTQDDQAG